MTSTYIQTGTTVRVYDSAVQTHPQLPVGTYTVAFNELTGYSLQIVDDMAVGEEKVYGGHTDKISKVFKTWDATSRSLGVMLSGDKGQGKSLFMRMLADTAIKRGLPVVRVTANTEGIAEYLDTLGTALIVFDEFDKVFATDRREGPREGAHNTQHQFLSLFDGTSSVRRMYCITFNDTYNVSEFVINRPGRFHYHIRFDYPNAAEVREYLLDNGAGPEIAEKTVRLSKMTSLNYDHLRAIAWEASIHPGVPFEDLIDDLNIKAMGDDRWEVHITLPDGATLTIPTDGNPHVPGEVDLYGVNYGGHNYGGTFRTSDLVFNEERGHFELDPAAYYSRYSDKEHPILSVKMLPAPQPKYNFKAF